MTGQKIGSYGSRNELDPRQRMLIRNYLDPNSPTFMNKGASARVAGYTYRNPAEALAPTRMAKNVRRAIEAAMEDAGITERLLAERHLALIKKNEVRFNPKTFKYEVTDQPDTIAVKAGLDMAYKLRGDYAPEKTLNAHIDLTTILNDIQSAEQPLVRNR